MIVYHDQNYIEKEKARISISAPGFQYGIGFFTTMKYSHNKFHFLAEHLNRLNQSAVDFQFQLEQCDVLKVLKKLMSLNRLKESRIKILVYLNHRDLLKYLIIPQKLIINKSPINVLTRPSNRGDNRFYRYKSMNYFENIYKKRLLRNSFYDDFLFHNEKGQLLELTTANIHFIKGNKIYTPDQWLPILPGIIRQILIQHPKTDVIEDCITIQQLSAYSGCFITNSICGVVPVSSITIEDHTVEYDVTEINKLPEEIRNI